MKIMGGMLLLFLGLGLSVPAVAQADTNSAHPTSQHESPEHDSTRSMKAYKKHQKKYQKQTRNAEKQAQKKAKKRAASLGRTGH